MSIPGKSFLTGASANVEVDAATNTEFVEDPLIGDYALDAEAKAKLRDQPTLRQRVGSVLATRRVRGMQTPVMIVAEASDPPGQARRSCVTVSLDELLARWPRGLALLDESLVNLSYLSDHPSDRLPLEERTRWLLFSPDLEPGEYVLKQLADAGFITPPPVGMQPIHRTLQITGKGWAKVAELREAIVSSSNKAFVAMWFDAKTKSTFAAGIVPALQDCGLLPVRIDLKEHNNKICDEIIAEIRSSRILIADFTGNRGGVYYEAGYAQGIGLQVIWTVHADALGEVHFDTRQYNHIVYETPEELRSKLTNRIRATIRSS